MDSVEFDQVVSGHWASTLHWGDARKRLTSFWLAAAMTSLDCTFCPYGDFRHIYDKDFMYKMKARSAQEVFERLEFASKKIIAFRDSIYVYMLMR